MPEFKIGDVVFLKSGGHHMTVATEPTDNRVICDWHDQNGNPHRADYTVDQLALSPPPLPQTQPSSLSEDAARAAFGESDWREKHGLR